MSTQSWGSDVPISMPTPPGQTEARVPMFGFVMTEWGLFHDITESDHERLSRPTFAPEPVADTVWGDADLVGGD